jgi:hypothetical protein
VFALSKSGMSSITQRNGFQFFPRDENQTDQSPRSTPCRIFSFLTFSYHFAPTSENVKRKKYFHCEQNFPRIFMFLEEKLSTLKKISIRGAFFVCALAKLKILHAIK